MKTPLLVSVTLCLALAEGCARREAPSSDATAVHVPARVRVAKTDRVIAPEPVLVTGVVLPVKRAVLSAKVMGSVAESVVRLSATPVLVVRAAAAKTRSLIEPLCVDCARIRKETSNATWWCPRHQEHHARPHGSSYSGASFDSSACAWAR